MREETMGRQGTWAADASYAMKRCPRSGRYQVYGESEGFAVVPVGDRGTWADDLAPGAGVGAPARPRGWAEGVPATLTVTEPGALETDGLWLRRTRERSVRAINRMYSSGLGEPLRRAALAQRVAEVMEPAEVASGESADGSEDEQTDESTKAAPAAVRADRADPFGLYAAGVRPVYAGVSGERPKESGAIGKRRLKTGARLRGEAEGAAMHVQGPRGGR